ncbi:MAG: hypothetical protein V2J24_10385 [Pseudomonadales bacterium]|jgi:hypothetical protein|nr:hypothetical protein [Pseudomonadales bacterium]
MSDPSPRLLTPLVIVATVAVVAFGVLRAVLLPAAWPSSLLGMLFLPVVLLVLERARRRRADAGHPLRNLRELRAGLVGAGVLLATAFLLSCTDELGITDSDGAGRSVTVLLASAIAVFADLLSTPLEGAARKKD